MEASAGGEEGLLRLFVYGTLQPGGSAHGLLAGALRGVRAGRVEGYALFACANHPGARPARGETIHGVVLELAGGAELLARLDAYEGCPGLYERERVRVQLQEGGVVEAWLYVLSEPPGVGWRPVPGGRWP